ncbi:protein of unknown function [bacterium A37T11]|nr:protein of unknown function [bacterium A37T11]
MEKLEKAFALFDAYNKRDPNVFRWEDNEFPEEYFLALKLHEWVLKLNPAAPEELQLAARSQHIGRWEITRDSYPPGRDGYLKWRKDLGLYHAERASVLMAEAGYGDDIISRVREIIQKKRIKADADVQTMENALCLVFLQYQYARFYPKYPDKIVNILWKSLLKMDAAGHRFALLLPYDKAGLAYIQEALALLPNPQIP